MTSTLTKPMTGHPRQVCAVRELVRSALLGLPDVLVDDAQTIASELSANALRHTRSGQPGGEFLLVVTVAADDVTVTVKDQGRDDDHGPEVLPQGRIESGLGLGICQTLGELTITGDRTGRAISVRLGVPQS